MDEILLTQTDLNIILEMSKKEYPSHAIPKTNSSRGTFLNIRKNLHKVIQQMALYFYDYGHFSVTKADGNPIPRKSDKLGEVWAAFYMGEDKKQSKQIYIHYNTTKQTIDVGFSFGFGSGATNKSSQQLINYGTNLALVISSNKNTFDNLFANDFNVYRGNWCETQALSADEWLTKIKSSPATCRIVKSFKKSLSFNDLANTISSLMFLMGDSNKTKHSTLCGKTKEERLLEYKRQLDIGEKGELFILEKEKEKLAQLNKSGKYPIHKSKESDDLGYDILSVDENGKKIYIEVKTTTLKNRISSSRFYMSEGERKKMMKHKQSYFVYWVFDIDGTPYFEKFSLQQLRLVAKDYCVMIKS